MNEASINITLNEKTQSTSDDYWKQRMREFYLGDEQASDEIMVEVFSRMERFIQPRTYLPDDELRRSLTLWFTRVVDAVSEIQKTLKPYSHFYALRRFLSLLRTDTDSIAIPVTEPTELTVLLPDYDIDALILRRCAEKTRFDVTAEYSFSSWLRFFFQKRGVGDVRRKSIKVEELSEYAEAQLPDKTDFEQVYEYGLDRKAFYRLIMKVLGRAEKLYFYLTYQYGEEPSGNEYLEALRNRGFSQYGSQGWITKVSRRVKIKKYLVGLENGFNDWGLTDLVEISEREDHKKLDPKNLDKQKSDEASDIRSEITLHMINRLWTIFNSDQEGLSAYRARFSDPEFRREFGGDIDWRKDLKRAQAAGAKKDVRIKILVPAYRCFRSGGVLKEFCSTVKKYSSNRFGEGIKKMFFEDHVDEINNPTNNSPSSNGGGGYFPKTPGGASKKPFIGESCFSFQHCRQLAHEIVVATDKERWHLEDCLYCQIRTREFRRLHLERTGVPQNVFVPSPLPARLSTEIKPQESRGQKVKNAVRRLDDFVSSVSASVTATLSRPLVAGLSVASVILVVGVIGFFVFRHSSGGPNVPRPDIQPSVANNNLEEAKSLPRDPNADVIVPERTDKPAIGSTSNSNRQKLDRVANDTNKSAQSSKKEVESSSSPLDSTGIPEAIHEFAKTVQNASEIPEPEDLRKWLSSPKNVRAGGDVPKLLSPNRLAIVETQPTFRWKSRKGASFQIIVRNEGKEEIARGENLTKKAWVIPPNILSPGIYYWEIVTFDKDGAPFAKTRTSAIFRIVDGKEALRVKSDNKSYLARTSYFIYVGLLNDAEGELKAELKKNPSSRKAQNILRQVQKWQRQLRSNN